MFIIVLFSAGIFYFDKYLSTGADVAYYLDLSAIASRGGSFLIDYIDYRIPIFSLIFSPIYKLGLLDFQNRYLMFSLIYSAYGLALYFLGFSISKSSFKSVVATLIGLMSITSVQFDPARNISVPLFYHTLELAGLLIVLSFFLGKLGNAKKIYQITALLAVGLLSGFSFLGRQTQIFLPALFVGYCIWSVYGYLIGKIIRKNILFILPFGLGFGLSALIIFWAIYTHNIEFFKLAKDWLFNYPRYAYNTTFYTVVKKFIITLYMGLPELRNINLPLFWLAYVGLIAYASRLFVNLKNLEDLKNYYQKNKKPLLTVATIAVMSIFTVLLTGSGARSHESSFFTLYFAILVFSLSKIGRENFKKTLTIGLLIFIFVLPNLIDFGKKEVRQYLSYKNQYNPDKFTHQIAEEIKKIADKNDTVLVLGGHPTVSRLVEYKLFMGLPADTISFYAVPKILGTEYFDKVKSEFKKIKIIYKLPDYPNLRILSGVKEDKSNEVYQFVENSIKTEFKEYSVVIDPSVEAGNLNSYGHPKDRAIIYMRK